jgi:hypothetical protein
LLGHECLCPTDEAANRCQPFDSGYTAANTVGAERCTSSWMARTCALGTTLSESP